jgi:putative aldouronate transport system substrate-binding protein
MTGVSRTSVDSSKAVEWLELVNTDKVVYNLMCVGVENKHWKWKDQGKEVIEQINDSGYNPTTDWMFGNQFNAYYRDERQVGSWEETKKINDSAMPSPTLGFVMDREPVKNEIAAVAAILGEYTPFGKKGIPASDLPKVVQQMKDAGADRVKDEMQKQIDLWKKGG